MSELIWASNWIKEQEFVYAKSYDKTFPHYYTTKDRCNDIDFIKFLQIVRKYGVLKSFYKKQYLYLELDGYEYWEMGRPIKAVQVLNKALINDDAKYRKYYVDANDELLLKSKLMIRDKYLDCLLNKNHITLLDQKKINFLLDNQRRIHGGGKNIIDNANQKIRYE